MNEIKLNETPLRTSRNFEINNIKLKNIEFPEKIEKFKTIEITKNTAQINENTGNIDLTYGARKNIRKKYF